MEFIAHDHEVTRTLGADFQKILGKILSFA